MIFEAVEAMCFILSDTDGGLLSHCCEPNDYHSLGNKNTSAAYGYCRCGENTDLSESEFCWKTKWISQQGNGDGTQVTSPKRIQGMWIYVTQLSPVKILFKD